MCCFNKKVLLGLAAVAVGILILAPQAFGAALPVLVLLACPLSMVLMMWAMSAAKDRCRTGPHTATTANESASTVGATSGDTEGRDRSDEVERLRAELAQLKAENAALERRAASLN